MTAASLPVKILLIENDLVAADAIRAALAASCRGFVRRGMGSADFLTVLQRLKAKGIVGRVARVVPARQSGHRDVR